MAVRRYGQGAVARVMSDYMHGDHDAQSVTALVKWYNPTKGFGFVSLEDGQSDAFLHVSVLERAGYQELPEGARLACQVVQGRRGLQVSEIDSVDLSTATAPAAGPRRGPPGGGDRRGPPGEEIEGTVKFFNPEKGFGFVVPDNGGQDVFVSARTLERAGINHLDPDQRVRVSVRMGDKGPLATRVELE